MQAGEIGVVITVEADVDMTGATANLQVRGPADAQPRALPALVVAGTQGQRATEATDFPVEGNYLIQLIADFPGGKRLKSPIKQMFVGGRFD